MNNQTWEEIMSSNPHANQRITPGTRDIFRESLQPPVAAKPRPRPKEDGFTVFLEVLVAALAGLLITAFFLSIL